MKIKFLLPQEVSGAAIFFLSTAVFAQQAIPRSEQSSSKDTTVSHAWSITPRVSLKETFTDNPKINQAGNGKQNELITEVSPGIRIEARTGRLKAYLDYALQEQFYAKNSNYNRSHNSLNSFGTFEAVDNWLFLDFSGVITQQSISAFGAQSPSGTTINSNSTETASYRLSPYIRGQLGSTAEYSLRYSLSTTQSDARSVSDIDVSQWTGQLRGSTAFQKLRWALDGNQQSTDYSRGRKTDAEMLRAMLTYSVLPQFRISVSGGRESNNYASLDQEAHITHGYGFDWTPTQRTKLSVFKESRFFGNGHNINFSHRFPMSSITFTDTRDVSVLPNQFTSVGLGSVYSLLYPQLSQQCTQAFQVLNGSPPTQSQIDNCVLSLLGNQANTQVTSSFLASQARVQRRQQLAFILSGARNTLTLLINRNESQSVLASTAANDDFSQSNVIKQQGFSLNLSHRLSEISNLNFLGSRQETTGSGSTNLKTTTNLYQVNISAKLGAKTTGSLSARRSEFDSNSNPYTENALIGTVSFIY